MADDKTKRSPQDAARININDYEVRYWSERFCVSEQRLRDAVEEVGVGAEAVEHELKG